jgi:hypothetical protein
MPVAWRRAFDPPADAACRPHDTMDFSVIVCTYNRAPNLPR